MGKKNKRKYPDIEEILSRPWCFYCERDFEDLKLLISHQKAKHFKCDRCGRRLNTAGGLSVHMNQVHKETLVQVENALPNRQAPDVEIFGIEGIPADTLDQHRSRIIQNFYQAQEDRRIATGNVQPGQRGGGGGGGDGGGGRHEPRKKIILETPEELKARLRAYVAMVRAQREHGGLPAPTSSGEFNLGDRQSFTPPSYPQPAAGGAAFPSAYPPPPPPPTANLPAGLPANFPATLPVNLPATLPARPTAPPGLPQRLQVSPAGQWSAAGAGLPPQTSLSGLGIGDGLGLPARPVPGGDDIDQLIRMAEAGIGPGFRPSGAAPPEEDVTEKRTRKDKGSHMFFQDPDGLGPEERMAHLAQYRVEIKG